MIAAIYRIQLSLVAQQSRSLGIDMRADVTLMNFLLSQVLSLARNFP